MSTVSAMAQRKEQTTNPPCTSFNQLVPTDDWELNLLLLKLARELDAADFQSMKFLCSGQKGVPKGILEKLDTPEKFFTYLRERGMISRDNLLMLQSFLWHLERRDLHEMTAEYARRVGDTLYFYAPIDQPENGFKHVKFHLAGNLHKFRRENLEALRHTVARLLFVPPEFIFLSGVEPSNSLLLTFMIHDQCVSSLKDLFPSHEVFSRLNVDTLYVDGERIQLEVAESGPDDDADKDDDCNPVLELYQRAQELEERVEETEIKMLESRQQLSEVKVQAQNFKKKEEYFRGLLCEVIDKERRSVP